MYEVKVTCKSAFQPSSPLDWSVSQFLWHEVTRSISTLPGNLSTEHLLLVNSHTSWFDNLSISIGMLYVNKR